MRRTLKQQHGDTNTARVFLPPQAGSVRPLAGVKTDRCQNKTDKWIKSASRNASRLGRTNTRTPRHGKTMRAVQDSGEENRHDHQRSSIHQSIQNTSTTHTRRHTQAHAGTHRHTHTHSPRKSTRISVDKEILSAEHRLREEHSFSKDDSSVWEEHSEFRRQIKKQNKQKTKKQTKTINTRSASLGVPSTKKQYVKSTRFSVDKETTPEKHSKTSVKTKKQCQKSTPKFLSTKKQYEKEKESNFRRQRNDTTKKAFASPSTDWKKQSEKDARISVDRETVRVYDKSTRMSVTKQPEKCPRLCANRQSETSPRVSANKQSEKSPRMSANKQSETSPRMSANKQSEKSPRMSANKQSEKSPRMFSNKQSEKSPRMSANKQSEKSPRMSANKTIREEPSDVR